VRPTPITGWRATAGFESVEVDGGDRLEVGFTPSCAQGDPPTTRGTAHLTTKTKDLSRREADISTQQSSPEEESRVSGSHEDPWRTSHPRPAPPQGPQAPERLTVDGKPTSPLPAGDREGEAPSRRFLRRHKLHKSSEFLRCYRRGRKCHGPLATLHHHPNEEGAARLGITASRKVGHAVVRFRTKRRIREIFRCWPGRGALRGTDVVVHLKPAAPTVPFDELKAEIERLLGRIVAESQAYGESESGRRGEKT